MWRDFGDVGRQQTKGRIQRYQGHVDIPLHGRRRDIEHGARTAVDAVIQYFQVQQLRQLAEVLIDAADIAQGDQRSRPSTGSAAKIHNRGTARGCRETGIFD